MRFYIVSVAYCQTFVKLPYCQNFRNIYCVETSALSETQYETGDFYTKISFLM